ncbi:MAG: ribonuclease P protein component [Bacteroidia bacterium]|nr:ribonuclease P protein component [Bacteroidia bacterium]
MKFSFRKEERLKSNLLIQKIFTEGHSLFLPPIRVVWSETEIKGKYPAQAGFSVITRNFRKAYLRNLLKRRMREAYRKNKSILYQYLAGKDKGIAMMILYIGKEICSFEEIELKIISSLQRLIKDCEKVH